MAKNIVNFKEAEKNALSRDFDLEKIKYALDHGGVTKEDLEEAMGLLSKATGKDLYVGTKRSPQSKVRFAQSMQNNLGFLYKQDYVTNKEKVFLTDIIPYIAFSSNCIVHDIKEKNPVPANISEIAKLIGITRQNTSLAVNSLVKKGLLFKGDSGVEGNNAKAYAIFVNPHIIYAGDKDNVNEALKVMFHKAMKMKVLKDLPDKLF
ncbi:helix-turn-helix domain-containing protein [Trichococcus sp. K1Tr]|uniref:Helix-turn-helix domain-containing protein n=1 Tax=Priestia flexa TaxID=86664 RepID=A0ABU4JBP6_9BACI|nr:MULTISPECIES: helix-turn-helix domain-containing protein [Bacilli]MBN8436421.1 MarR family transcriptional regulator [Priestia flexa]MCA0968954.1 MarR family transcriptional regulator [Priestia flexa]MDB6354720.1 helix-turn-helix domain-containing protein [Trichococcus sp. K1Tr]MDW8518431.1 helix-turn-helix domain-containing protein [Priestia flexa]MEC0666277.1 helix-turn-helix domain-containing protein [Priestia flexa]